MKKTITQCPVCQTKIMHYLRSIEECRIIQCPNCSYACLGSGAPEQPANILQNNEVNVLREIPSNLHSTIHLKNLENTENPSEKLGELYQNIKVEAICITFPKIPHFSKNQFGYFTKKSARDLCFYAGFKHIKCLENIDTITITAGKSTPTNIDVSIIVPAYNEEGTLHELLTKVLSKKLAGLTKEVIIVESKSSDRTREIIETFQHPELVKLYQEKPCGKGNAVREGLAIARGDIIMIQDADLEYDLEDYETVLEPILSRKTAFVLGARHGGTNVWKLRKFENQKSLASILNLGHLFFGALVNILFHQKIKDPFTMYKVFRRDTIEGIIFKCNKFDFDYELLIKIIKNGFIPLEVPVNYRSRSFLEGKKVRIIADPISWLIVLVKLKLNII